MHTDPSTAGPVYVRDPKLVVTVTADLRSPSNAMCQNYTWKDRLYIETGPRYSCHIMVIMGIHGTCTTCYNKMIECKRELSNYTGYFREPH